MTCKEYNLTYYLVQLGYWSLVGPSSNDIAGVCAKLSDAMTAMSIRPPIWPTNADMVDMAELWLSIADACSTQPIWLRLLIQELST